MPIFMCFEFIVLLHVQPASHDSWQFPCTGLIATWPSCNVIEQSNYLASNDTELSQQYLARDAPPPKNGIFGNFSQVSDPPPFGNPCFQKKKYGLFCNLGYLEHFWSSSKCSLFGNYSDIYFWEQVTPPLSKEKFPKLLVFAHFFSEFFRFQIKSYVIKSLKYHLPTIVKHVLAPKNDFGIPKITWLICKSFGN